MNHNHNQAHQSSKRVLASTSSPNRTSGTFRIDILRFLLDSSRRSNRGACTRLISLATHNAAFDSDVRVPRFPELRVLHSNT